MHGGERQRCSSHDTSPYAVEYQCTVVPQIRSDRHLTVGMGSITGVRSTPYIQIFQYVLPLLAQELALEIPLELPPAGPLEKVEYLYLQGIYLMRLKYSSAHHHALTQAERYNSV